MKHMKKVFVTIVLVIGMISIMQAQESKVAHINTQALVEAMPSYIAANADLERTQKKYQAQLTEMKTELQKTSEGYGLEVNIVTDETNISRQKEVEGTLQQITLYEQNAYQKLREQEQELLKPILEKARVTIQKVGRAKGFLFVLDSTPGSAGVILVDGYDLMPDVKADLGI
jgi:outer membrane protein